MKVREYTSTYVKYPIMPEYTATGNGNKRSLHVDPQPCGN